MELKAPKILKKDAVYWAGGGQELAARLNVTRGTVYDWDEYLPKWAAWMVETLQLRERIKNLELEHQGIFKRDREGNLYPAWLDQAARR